MTMTCRFSGLMAQTTLPLRRLLQFKLDLDIGWHGSYQGRAYARAFDYLKEVDPEEELGHHLDRHYTQTDTGRCRYEPGTPGYPTAITLSVVAGSTFALDSNTFNAPPPLLQLEGDAYRHLLKIAWMSWSSKTNSLKPPPASALTCPTKLNSSMTCVPI